MSTQLILPGFPEPFHREAYTAPKQPSKVTESPKLWQPLTQCVSISPDCFTLYNDTSQIRKRKKLLSAAPQQMVIRILNTGTMSRGAASRMKRAINYLGLISKEKSVYNVEKSYFFKFKQSFITLTLSDKQKHSDHFIKNKLFKNFIDAIRKRYPGISYVWKAETQNNGNLHFHIITDHFIPTFYINSLWNRIQWHYGYMQKYMAKNGHMKAPSCEVRKVKKDKDLSKYMRKYMLKGLSKSTPAEINAKIDSLKNQIAFCTNTEQKQKLEALLITQYRLLNELKKRKVMGKLWGCSDNLLLPPYRSEIESLSTEDRQLLFENEIIVDTAYYQVFRIVDFKYFLNAFSKYTHSYLLDHYKKLLQRVRPPVMQFKTNTNYSYT